MASTYSSNLKLELMGTGDQSGTWGDTTNSNLGTLLEQAVVGYATQAITDGADTVLTIANGASSTSRNYVLELTGALTANRNLVVPAIQKPYTIYNNTSGGFAVTVKVSGQTGVAVAAGKKAIVYNNGTDIVEVVNAPVTEAGTQTLTNKTLTNPTINGFTGNTAVVNIGSGQFYKDTSGNVGIGTTSPTAKLDVYTGSASNTYIYGRNTAGTALYGVDSGGGAYAWSTNNQIYVGTQTAFPISFLTNNAERMRIDSSGNVGIGSTSPDGILHTNSFADASANIAGVFSNGEGQGTISANTQSRIYISASGTPTTRGTYIAGFNVDGSAAGNGHDLRFFVSDSNAAPTERFRFAKLGQLGIGGANYGTAGQVLTSGGASAAPTWSTPSSGKIFLVHELTSGTTFTPTTGVKSLYVAVIGATGGEGTGARGGRGGPGFSETHYTTVASSYSYSIGAAGSTSGTAGGTTTFGSMSVTGSAGASGTGGTAGGVGSGGTFNASGGSGGSSVTGTTSSGGSGGGGGAGTRAGNGGNGANGVAGTGGGGGGTGGNNASGATPGAAATSKAAGALNLATIFGVNTFSETFAAGEAGGLVYSVSGGNGAVSTFDTSLPYVLRNIGTSFGSLGSFSSTSEASAGMPGKIVVVEIF